MSVELLYTSAPNGLKQGSRGFCTVLSTQGMPVNLASRLELLSGYRHIFPPQDAQANLNPVAWSHVSLTVAGQTTSILSRIAAYGVDYSGRTNKLAHHVVVGPNERIAAGPAWLLQSPGVMRSQWDGVCETPASGPAIPQGNQTTRVCTMWKSLTGDAGWGGVVAEALVAPAGKPLWVIYRLDQQRSLLELMNESISLLPESQRWQATFSTYYTNLPPEVDCKVRFVVEGTEEATKLASRGSSILLAPGMPLTSASAFVESARTGTSITMPAPAAPITRTATPIDIESLWDEPANKPLHHPSKVSPPSATLGTSLPESPPAIALPPKFKGATPPAIHTHKSRKSNSRIASIIGVSILLMSFCIGGFLWNQPRTQLTLAHTEPTTDERVRPPKEDTETIANSREAITDTSPTESQHTSDVDEMNVSPEPVEIKRPDTSPKESPDTSKPEVDQTKSQEVANPTPPTKSPEETPPATMKKVIDNESLGTSQEAADKQTATNPAIETSPSAKTTEAKLDVRRTMAKEYICATMTFEFENIERIGLYTYEPKHKNSDGAIAVVQPKEPSKFTQLKPPIEKEEFEAFRNKPLIQINVSQKSTITFVLNADDKKIHAWLVARDLQKNDRSQFNRIQLALDEISACTKAIESLILNDTQMLHKKLKVSPADAPAAYVANQKDRLEELSSVLRKCESDYSAAEAKLDSLNKDSDEFANAKKELNHHKDALGWFTELKKKTDDIEEQLKVLEEGIRVNLGKLTLYESAHKTQASTDTLKKPSEVDAIDLDLHFKLVRP